MGAIRDWYLALSRREQVLIGALAAIVAVVIAIYGIILPLDRALDDARARYSASLAAAAQVEGKVEMLREPEKRPQARLTGALDEAIGRSAEAQGFTVEQLVRQDNDRVSLTIPSARPQSLYGWLAELEQQGLQPESVTVTPQAEGTVSVELNLRRGAR